MTHYREDYGCLVNDTHSDENEDDNDEGLTIDEIDDICRYLFC